MMDEKMEAQFLRYYENPELREHIDRYITSEFLGDYAVFILDTSGFTRITEKYGIIHFLSIIVKMRHLVRREFERYGAVSYWFEADNAYGIFTDPKESFSCARSIQEHISMHNSNRPSSDRIGVCIGLGYGSLLKIGEREIYGQEMNLASKLGEDIADPGEILLTRGTYDTLNNTGIIPSGEWRSANISGVHISYYCCTMK